jgi:putative polymerase
VLAVQWIGLYSGRDDFAGRLSYTIELLVSMDFMDYMGLSNRLIETSADSGIVYLIITQSIVIVTLLWILIVTELKEQSPMQRHYKNGITTYIALTMLVSFSFVSIKTAAPLWFIYGVLTTLSRKDIKFGH